MQVTPSRLIRVVARLVLAVAFLMAALPAAAQPLWIAPGPAQAPADPCPLLRREFTLDQAPTSAKIRIVGLGHYELRCNGKVVGDTVINQAWSQYDKTLYQQEFDLTPHLRPGPNVLAVVLGNSFWSVRAVNDPNRFSKTDAMPDFSAGNPFLLWIDGTVRTGAGEQRLQTDESWTWSPGPLTFSHIYAGEDYDARLAPAGWDAPGFDASAWKPVRAVEPPAARLAMNPSPGMKTFIAFKATEIKRPEPGISTYVFPQNCSALLRFTIDGGKPGDRVRFKPCEYMDDTGRVKFTYTWGTKKDIWHDYIKATSGPESHQTVFCYVGAQFVQVEGAVPEGDPNPDGLPVIRSLEHVQVRVACREAGLFKSQVGMHNKAHDLVTWSIRSNMAHVPTDCPHREKNGWLEQNWHMGRSMSYSFDINDWFKKTCRDMRDTQLPDGHVPTNSPNYLVGVPPHGFWNEAPEWGIASVLVPWHLYEWYGDQRTLAESFDSARRYVEYLASTAKGGVITSNLGDWYDYGHGKGNGPSQWTPAEVSATAIWAYGAQTLARAATVLGRRDDAARYTAMYAQVRGEFIRRFYDPSTKTFKNGGSCQAANATALCIGLYPEADKDGIVQAIVDDLEKRGHQQTTGEVLHIFLIRALAENGRGDVLHRVYSRDEVASYGHMVKSGLTTLPESWDGKKGTGDSLNHFMLGQLVEWHYAYVAGIRQSPGSVGWKKVIIAPQPPPRSLLVVDGPGLPGVNYQNIMTSAAAGFLSPAGKIISSWEIVGPEFKITTDVPVGMDAELVMPDGQRRRLTPGKNEFRCKTQ
ncbi:MAG: hypothetical protein GIKADHBN_00215 [Phycisphaerales bacterium]|nr:hypothetical protein [Phycisphaerales bacterium]